MMDKQPEKLELTSMDIARSQRDRLKELFPTVFTEAKNNEGKIVEGIDFEKLKAELGNFSELFESRKERYGMDWPGKKDSLRVIQETSVGTLSPMLDKSLNFFDTQNVFIEGDNLESLKLLQKSYYGKVKMIFIDPPYNTGKEFIYPDKYSESLQTYLEFAGMVDSTGKKFSTNTTSEGRYHTKWLNMMYPRLYLARNLLKEDGTIFISIDDNEVTNLRKLCDEIFGEENFVTDLIWEKRFTRNNDAKLMSSVIDHILLYRKSNAVEYLREPRTEKANSIYSNPDNDARGPWTSVSYISQRTKEQRPNLAYKVRNPLTNVELEHPVNAWKYSFSQYEKHALEGRLYWGKEGNNQFPRLKRFLSELEDGIVPINLWNYKDTGTIDDGTKVVDELVGKDVFDYPKPYSLIMRMLAMATSSEDDIVLDFFAGSGTTAHAVLEMNKKYGGHRKFILVQLPEPTPEASNARKMGFKTICDVTHKRLSKVCENLKKDSEDPNKQLALDSDDPKSKDFGFRYFKLVSSNFKLWDGNNTNDVSKLERQLEFQIQNLKSETSQENILFEILLKAGFPLSEKILKFNIAGKQVFSVSDGALLVCLESTISKEVIDEVAKLEPIQFICLDSAFHGNDQLKANAVQTFQPKDDGAGKNSQTTFRTV